jgi:hypothetical protein
VDDMTMWTGARVRQRDELLGGPGREADRTRRQRSPSEANPASIAAGQPSVNVIVTGTQAAGSGFYDPGSNLGGSAVPFSHIGASVTGGVTVNSVTFTSPTQITVNVSTVGAASGAQSVTVTNPDGQTRTGNGILTVGASAGGPPSLR